MVLETESAEWIGSGGPTAVELPSVAEAVDLFNTAVAHASSLGLNFAEPVRLEPKANLRSLLALTFTTSAIDDE